MAAGRIAAAFLVLVAAGAGCAWLADGGQDLAAIQLAPPVAAANGASAREAPAIDRLPVASAVPAASPAAVSTAAGPSPVEGTQERLRRAGFDAEWLAAHGFSTPQAQERLAALLDAGRELPGVPGQRLAIHPSGTLADGEREQTVLSPEERYVVADLTAPLPVAQDAVIVRWRRPGDDAVLELGAQLAPATPGEPLQLWMFRPQGWEPGRYRLEVISADPRLAVMAAGDFRIAAPGEQPDAFAYAVQDALRR